MYRFDFINTMGNGECSFGIVANKCEGHTIELCCKSHT